MQTAAINGIPIVAVVPAERIALHTTLNRLREAGACTERYQHLLRALGGPSFHHEEPINLLTILEHNGVEDCLWALCATAENCDQVARLMACDFAEAVLPIFERDYPDDRRPRVAIETARRFARAECTADELAAARTAAWAVAWDVWDAAWEAIRAARAAAWAAVGDIARAARAAGPWAAAGDVQADIIRRYLLPDSATLNEGI